MRIKLCFLRTRIKLFELTRSFEFEKIAFFWNTLYIQNNECYRLFVQKHNRSKFGYKSSQSSRAMVPKQCIQVVGAL